MRLLVKDLSEGRIEERGYWDEADCFGTSLELSPGFNGEADSFDAARPREPVTFEVYAEALFEDGWHQSEPVPVTVSRPEATVYQLSAPMTVREGAPYTFTVTGLDNADNWWWDIYVEKKIQHRDGTDWVTIWRCSANDRAAQTETTFSIPAELLEADSCYRVNVWADGREASGCGLYKDFFVTRSKNPTDGNLRLTIEYNGEEYDGSGGEVLNAPVRADVHMKVTGLGDATALRWYNGCEWHFYEQVENGVAEWDERLDTENVQYFVSACHDAIDWDAYYEQGMDWCEMDLNWGGISNIVRVNVQVDGISAPARVVCAPDDGVVTRGDLLHVTILPPEEDATGYGTEFCAYFRAWDNGEDYRWAEWRSDYFEEWGDGLSFDLRTSELPADRDYSLIVESSAPGYNWRSQRVFDFTVVEPELGDHEMQFIVSNLEWDEEQQTHFAWGGDWISFAAYAPDASRIDVVLHPLDLREDHEDRIWDFYGDCAIGDFDEGWEAPYELYAVAYDEEDNEIARSDTWSVEIRSHGDMEPATVEGDVRTAANEEYRFTVYGLNQLGDEEYDWSQPYEGDGNPSEISRFTRDGWSDEGYENDDGTFTFVIPADKLQTNHFYRINTWVDQTGWRGVGGEFRFFVYDAMSGDVKLRVNGSETEASGMAHSDDFRIEIDAPGATAVRLTIGNGWDYMYDFDPEAGSVVRDSYWFDSGEYVVYAQACYEDFDWDSVCDGSLPWEALAWSAVSENSVYVTVEDKGDAFAAELDQEAYEVTRGELLRFEIVGAGDVDDPRRATNFHAYIVDEDYGWDGSNDASLHADDAEAFPMEVYLSTGYLEPERNYRLIVDSCAPEYAWVSLEVPLTVTEPEGDGVPFVFQVQDNLIDNEEFRFSAYERDASWMEVFAHNVDDGENHDYDPRWEYPGNYVNGRGSLSEGTYRMWAVAHYTDEEGNETGEPRLSDELEVVVGVHGDMQPAQAYGSRVFHVGGDYSFVVYDLHQMGDNWYDIRVRDDFGEWPEGYEGDEDPCEIMRFTRDEYGDGIDEFTIPADMIVPGHRYSINVWVDANGWRGQGSNFWFYACEDGDGYTLRLPGAPTEIDEEAFAGVDARMIIVPDGVTSIGERAFADCPNLQVVISPVELPDNALEGCGWEVYVDTPAGE